MRGWVGVFISVNCVCWVYVVAIVCIIVSGVWYGLSLCGCECVLVGVTVCMSVSCV